MRTIPLTTCFAAILALLAAAALAPLHSSGATYDYTAYPEGDETFNPADFRVYISDSIAVVRGVYFYVDPYLADSRYIVGDEAFQALCAADSFALMGARLENSHMETGVGNGVLRALTDFAGASNHPEVAFSTIFFDGFSWGGQFSYHFTKWNPARVIGFVTEKGGQHDTTAAGDAILVPGYMFIAENDLPYRIANLTGIFEQHRPLGARWILAMEPDGVHSRVTDRNLLDDYFRTVAALRLPAVIPLGEPVVLRDIPEESGWLGDRERFAIGAFACYDGAIGDACWFPTRRVGELWQGFVSDSTVTDTIPCGPMGIEIEGGDGGEEAASPRLLSPLAVCFPNPFPAPAALRFDLDRAAPVELAVFDATGRRVATLCDGWLARGAHAIVWDGRDARGRRLASGVYHHRLTAGGRSATGTMILVR